MPYVNLKCRGFPNALATDPNIKIQIFVGYRLDIEPYGRYSSHHLSDLSVY